MIEVVNINELSNLIEKNNIVVVNFYAQWCNPCKSLASKFEKVAGEWDGTKVLFANFNIDIDLDVVKSMYSIRAIPSIVVFSDYGEKTSFIKDPSDITIDTYLKKITSP